MKVNLGGDRIGSGSNMEVSMRNYKRSTHNLSQRFTSSAAPGVLYPFLKLVSMRADAFDIDLDAACLTIPTQGPLFGSFKMQLDLYQCPWRLYQALLHNNPTAIGLKANQIVLPQIKLQTYQGTYQNDKKTAGKIKENTLLKYLGMSGIGQIARTSSEQRTLQRSIQCIPMLAYYDIFKNYYSNKQEENAFVIARKENNYFGLFYGLEIQNTKLETIFTSVSTGITNMSFSQEYKNNNLTYIIYLDTDTNPQNIQIEYSISVQGSEDEESISEINHMEDLKTNHKLSYEKTKKGYKIYLLIDNILQAYNYTYEKLITLSYLNFTIDELKPVERKGEVSIKPFKLKNIDDMRMEILSKHTLGNPFVMRIKGPSSSLYGDWNEESGTDATGLPYSANFNIHLDNNEHPILDAHDTDMCGLVLKTYQADLFNNWINTDWIDGENGINEITKVAVTDGAFTIDALNLAEKLYNLLNRVAVCGNTYEDWQDAVYTQSPRRHIESPVFIGGASYEVVFEQIVQNTPAEIDGETTTLGTLGGKGKLIKRKGGRVHVKIDEPSYIIGIVSLTPRVDYTQGNDWDLTELKTLDDLHKPELDGIGFQDLIGEQMLWSDARVAPDGSSVTRSKIGKVPAWINYMTAVDKAYGDFAQEEGKAFMILGRNYEQTDDGLIKDATTYIDPSKYNYAFAYTELAAQNFWIQVDSKITARRLMSAKQIPNV